MNAITTDWNGKDIGIGTIVNIDNGDNIINKSGTVTEVIFKGDGRDEIYLRVSGIRNLTSLQYVTVIDLTELESEIYRMFSENGIGLGIGKLREYSDRISSAIGDEPDEP